MTLLFDKVLVLPIPEENNTGLILPESAKEKPSRGTVVSTGKGKPNEPMELKEGDIVYYQSSVGFDFKYKGEVHKVLRQSDVYLVE